MSTGSTRLDAAELERRLEALVLLCESLELLGDRYAIYGFSGFTHKRCELLRIKRFDEALEYLPHMYGPASFTVVGQVERLPFRVSDIYRRITR